MNTIYLLTSSYPFGDGEQFLETEIKYLTKYSDVLVIIPNKCYGNKRPVPSNVYVYDLFAEEALKTLSITKILYALFTILKKPPVIKLNRLFIKVLIKSAYYKMLGEKHLMKLISEQDNPSDRIVVYSYWFSSLMTGTLALKKHYPNLKVVTRAHRSDLYERASNIPEFPFRKEIIHDIDKVFSISMDGVRHLERKFNSRNIMLSRLGVTFDTKGNIPNKKPGHVMFVSCSYLKKIKRVSKILKSIDLYSKNNPKVHVQWIHIGNGPLMAELEQQIEQANQTNKNLSCKLLGHVSNQRVKNFYRNNHVDCFINLSTSEGIPVSIMEAISFGIPIIATDVGGVSEIVLPTTGVLVNNEFSTDQVANALEKVLSPENKDNYRHGAKKTWSKHYNASNNYTSFCEELEKLFDKPKTEGDISA